MSRSSNSFYVAELYVSYRTEQKLLHKHHISVAEVENAVLRVVGLRGVWNDEPDRGWRLLVQVTIRGRRALIVLYPTRDRYEWNLGSAYFRA